MPTDPSAIDLLRQLREFTRHANACGVHHRQVFQRESSNDYGASCVEETWMPDPLPCSCGLSALLGQIEAPQPEPGWYLADSAPQDNSAFRAYGPELVHADFNPWGQVEACFDGDKFVGAVWDGQFDCWNTVPITFTHWQRFPDSPGQAVGAGPLPPHPEPGT